MNRAKAQLQSAHLGEVLERLQALLHAQAHYVKRLLIKSGGRITFLPIDEIHWIEAEGKWALVHTNDQTHRLRESLSSLERKLDPQRFVRVHRSTIVNVECIKEIHPWFHGDLVLVLHNGTELKVSRRYKAELEARLGGCL